LDPAETLAPESFCEGDKGGRKHPPEAEPLGNRAQTRQTDRDRTDGIAEIDETDRCPFLGQCEILVDDDAAICYHPFTRERWFEMMAMIRRAGNWWWTGQGEGFVHR
jgi:hypothetical protein